MGMVEGREGRRGRESSIGRVEVIGADPHPQGLFAICSRRKWWLRGRWESRSRGVPANEEECSIGMVGGVMQHDTIQCGMTFRSPRFLIGAGLGTRPGSFSL